MFLFCDYITIWSNFLWQGGHSMGWVLQQWNGSLVPWQPRTDWLIKMILHYRVFFISPFTFALWKDQKLGRIWRANPSGDRKGKIRQNGHYHKCGNHLEGWILEGSWKESPEMWRADWMGGGASVRILPHLRNSQRFRKIAQASELKTSFDALNEVNCQKKKKNHRGDEDHSALKVVSQELCLTFSQISY